MTAKRITRITIGMLTIGLGIAAFIYFNAQPEVEPPFGDPLMSKRYIHELGVYGGKSNVMMAQFMEEFKALWRGRTLGETVAVLTILVTLIFRFLALRPDLFAPMPEFEVKAGPPAEQSVRRR